MQQQFNIPEYYGHNPDALWDAVYLWFREPTVIEVRDLDKLPESMEWTGELLRKVFQRLDQMDPCVQVVFQP